MENIWAVSTPSGSAHFVVTPASAISCARMDFARMFSRYTQRAGTCGFSAFAMFGGGNAMNCRISTLGSASSCAFLKIAAISLVYIRLKKKERKRKN